MVSAETFSRANEVLNDLNSGLWDRVIGKDWLIESLTSSEFVTFIETDDIEETYNNASESQKQSLDNYIEDLSNGVTLAKMENYVVDNVNLKDVNSWRDLENFMNYKNRKNDLYINIKPNTSDVFESGEY